MFILSGSEFKTLNKHMHHFPISGVLIESSKKETFFDYESLLLDIKDTLNGGFIMHHLEGELDHLVHEVSTIKPYLDADDYIVLDYNQSTLAFLKTNPSLKICVKAIEDYTEALIALKCGAQALFITFDQLAHSNKEALDLLKALALKQKDNPVKLIAEITDKETMNQALISGADYIIMQEAIMTLLLK
jgi:hypothetical protein